MKIEPFANSAGVVALQFGWINQWSTWKNMASIMTAGRIEELIETKYKTILVSAHVLPQTLAYLLSNLICYGSILEVLEIIVPVR